MLKLDSSYLKNFVSAEEINNLELHLLASRRLLYEKKGAGAEFTGWFDLPLNYDRQEFTRIKEAAARIKEQSDILIVCGIGGSYLGARAVVSALEDPFLALKPKEARKNPLILYAGHQMSGAYLKSLLQALDNYRVSLNIISKSGTTTEPALSFRILAEWLENRYGSEEAQKRIYATTDKQKGALKQLADQKGYETFSVPDEIGGRYSVLTAVGLLPIAAAGIDIDDLMAGAGFAYEKYYDPMLWENDSDLYALNRNILQKKGYNTEILVNYDPGLSYLSEWWKQLFGESEGKDGRGIYPASANFTTDLHSLGQYIQAGGRFLMETVLQIESQQADIVMPEMADDRDGLNFLAGKSLTEINQMALYGSLIAHIDGGVPVQLLKLSDLSAFSLGELIYFFQRSCAVSAYLAGVNPFDQPGVESYKKNMYALLGKPGFENERRLLEERLPKEMVAK